MAHNVDCPAVTVRKARTITPRWTGRFLPSNGEQPDAVQNLNVSLFARLAREGLAARHGDDAFVFARNVADSGRQHTAVWSGDAAATFVGLAYSVTAGLRSGALVMPMWGSDTGGYLRGPGAPSEEVFARCLDSRPSAR